MLVFVGRADGEAWLQRFSERLCRNITEVGLQKLDTETADGLNYAAWRSRQSGDKFRLRHILYSVRYMPLGKIIGLNGWRGLESSSPARASVTRMSAAISGLVTSSFYRSARAGNLLTHLASCCLSAHSRLTITRVLRALHLPPDPCQEKARRLLPRLRRLRRGARWARKRFARAPRVVRIAGSVAILLAVVALAEHRLSRDPQADRAVRPCRQRARQGAGRELAAIRAAVPHLFHRDDHARIAGRAGAGREFGQSGGAHLLALAIEPQSASRSTGPPPAPSASTR